MSAPTSPEERALREALLDLYEALDPQHQGECWPDPIEWDGRPLREQAEEALSSCEPQPGDLPDDLDPAAAPTRAAAEALRAALGAAL